MYSVIIQNQQTADAFAKYHPLFLEALKNNTIGLCKWVESGTTIDTALPELRELTDNKEYWRAIIVRMVDGEAMRPFAASERNPFDFEINSNPNNEVRESEVPLIRLTHLLGGIPAPDLEFKNVEIKEPHKAARTIYEPIYNEERERDYRQLSQKYVFDGKPPVSILIVSIREDYHEEDNIEMAWKTYRESESSEFWKRNQYPSICRFLVYDFLKKGPVQRKQDEFSFWSSVLLLGLNEIDSATLQAYRLYSLKTYVNRELMEESFQNTIDRLRDEKHAIKEMLRREEMNKLSFEEELPDYKMDVPVAIDVPKHAVTKVKNGTFSLLGKGASTEIEAWNRNKEDAEKSLTRGIKLAERTLDQTADRIKDNFIVEEELAVPLDRYQQEDLKLETENLYGKMLEEQSNLPNTKVIDAEEVEKASDKVKQYLKGRVTGLQFFRILVVLIVLILLSTIPSIFKLAADKEGTITGIISTHLIEMVVVAIAALIILVVQKIKLNTLLERYNRILKNAFNRLYDSSQNYTEYLSSIASLARGRSFLDMSRKKERKEDSAKTNKLRHIKIIDITLGRLKDWGEAFQLKNDFSSPMVGGAVVTHTEVDPQVNELYTFESGGAYPVPINHSGSTIKSPFGFIKRLDIVREELYDDDIQ